MNKTELIEKIAIKSKLTKADAGRALNSFIDAVSEALAKKKDVTLVGFGTFTTVKRSARTGRNPQTGATIRIPATVAPKFRAGKALKKAVA